MMEDNGAIDQDLRYNDLQGLVRSRLNISSVAFCACALAHE